MDWFIVGWFATGAVLAGFAIGFPWTEETELKVIAAILFAVLPPFMALAMAGWVLGLFAKVLYLPVPKPGDRYDRYGDIKDEMGLVEKWVRFKLGRLPKESQYA